MLRNVNTEFENQRSDAEKHLKLILTLGTYISNRTVLVSMNTTLQDIKANMRGEHNSVPEIITFQNHLSNEKIDINEVEKEKPPAGGGIFSYFTGSRKRGSSVNSKKSTFSTMLGGLAGHK